MTGAVLYFDGGIPGGNPGGTPTYGWVIEVDGEVVAEGCGVAEGKPTNNVAEWSALVAGLEALQARFLFGAEVRGDSELVIRQVIGAWRCKAPHLQPRCELGRRLAEEMGCTFRWIPREENARADALARKAVEG